jgi:hypothetical protein
MAILDLLEVLSPAGTIRPKPSSATLCDAPSFQADSRPARASSTRVSLRTFASAPPPSAKRCVTWPRKDSSDLTHTVALSSGGWTWPRYRRSMTCDWS